MVAAAQAGYEPEQTPEPRWRNAARARRRAAAERQRAELHDRQPAHVQHCYHNGSRDWWIYTWRKDSARTVKRVPYTCDSWRCTVCRRHDASVQFARIQEAAKPLDPLGWVFLTLTLRRDRVESWATTDLVYKDLSRRNRNFFQRLRRWCVEQGWYDERIRTSVNRTTGKRTTRIQRQSRWSSRWVGVVEAHRSGWPHMHFAIHCPELASYLRQNPQAENLLPAELQSDALDTGWGDRCTIEPARSSEALAGYLTKLAGEAGELTGELAKLTQLPTTAPIRFRRLRAGKNFLPPRRVNPDYTGTLIRRKMTVGGYDAEPIHRVKDEPLIEYLCIHEERSASKAASTQTPEHPVTELEVPAKVFQTWVHDERRKTDRSDRDPAPGPGQGDSLLVAPAAGVHGQGKSPPAGSQKENERWQRRNEGRAKPLTCRGAPSAAATRGASTTNPPEGLKGSHERPRRSRRTAAQQAGLFVVSSEQSATQPTRSAESGSDGQQVQAATGPRQRSQDQGRAQDPSRWAQSQDPRAEKATAPDAPQGAARVQTEQKAND